MNKPSLLSAARWVALGAAVSLITGCGGGGSSSSSGSGGSFSGTHYTYDIGDQAHRRYWTPFGDTNLESRSDGLVIRNYYWGYSWSSTGILFNNAIGHKLDCTNGCQINLRVKALDGLRVIAVTEYPQGQDWRLGINKTYNVSSGSSMQISFNFGPLNYPPLPGIAIHMGAHFATTATGNPAGSALLLESASVTEYPAAARTTQATASVTHAQAPDGQSITTPATPEKAPTLRTVRADRVIGSDPPSSYRSIVSAAERRKGALQDLGKDTADIHDVTVIPLPTK